MTAQQRDPMKRCTRLELLNHHSEGLSHLFIRVRCGNDLRPDWGLDCRPRLVQMPSPLLGRRTVREPVTGGGQQHRDILDLGKCLDKSMLSPGQRARTVDDQRTHIAQCRVL
jgi:hypothetical protein